ncbi:MAG: MBL fold metallo-hydrolase [Dermatophilaceae bacterium]
MTAVRVELIVAGSCRSVGGLAVAGQGLRPIDFPALVAVIEHPRTGIVLFDTGYTDRFDEQTRPFPQRFYRWLTPMRLAPEATVVAQLAARDISADDVEHVVVSHLHADHVAGLRDFPRARITFSNRETPPGWRGRLGLVMRPPRDVARAAPG